MPCLCGWFLLSLLTLGSFQVLTESPGFTAESSASSSADHAQLNQHAGLLGRLWPPNATVIAGGSLPLALDPCAAPDSSQNPSTPANGPTARLLKQCKTAWLQDDQIARWFVNGIPDGSVDTGTVAPDQTPQALTALYHAPAHVPRAIPVAVSVEYPYFDTSGNTRTLVSKITVVNPPKCQDYQDITEMIGHVHFAYHFTGADSRGDNLRLSQSAAVAGILSRSNESDGDRLIWRGPVHHSASLGDGRTMGRAQMSLKGSGAPHDSSEMVLRMRLSDCTYEGGLLVNVETEETIRIGFVAIPEQKAIGPVGSVRIGVRPIADGLSGSARLTVGEQPASQETDDRFYPGGLGKAFITQGFATEDSAGKADVSWSFGPSK